jgi:hypothetical protein
VSRLANLVLSFVIVFFGVGVDARAHDILAEDADHALWHEYEDILSMGTGADPFRQLLEWLPTPDGVRLASGAPGPNYWQNEADHVIDVVLDPDQGRLTGSERITYHNRSPDTLTYLWLQLDVNRFREDSLANRSGTRTSVSGSQSIGFVERLQEKEQFEAGSFVTRVEDSRGRPLPYTIIDTMMRIDLPQPLASGRSVVFEVDWYHHVTPEVIGGRSQLEILDDDVPIYEIAQWFPRMAAYTDVDGWQNKAFLGRGEFTLEFGDYELRITVPDTYVVASSGILRNASQVLTREQRVRLSDARTADEPVLVITQEEADANRTIEATGTKTWIYRADNVRDVAWAASPSFLWDAWGVDVEGQRAPVMAMSYWPSEGEPLWSRYSTHAVAQTLEVYGEYAFPYPYPTAISVNGPVGGMEYPMICFNGPRPEEDGTYTSRTKYGLISVIIHEVGHNWFPMIVNSDERQWTWMDEGLNTYLQFLAEQHWEKDYPSRRGEPRDMTSYMTSGYARPIMTNSESLLQFGSNAYGKPATALNVLRETVLGREAMDHAFRTYASDWAFKRPQPADLFRRLEDVSGTDLDWFWRGWFYTTAHADVAIEKVTHTQLARDPAQRKGFEKAARDDKTAPTRTEQRNEGLPLRTDRFPELVDFYSTYDELDVTPEDERAYERFLDELEDDQRAAFDRDWHFYTVRLRNVGGLVSPVPIVLEFEDGTSEEHLLPAEIWVRNAEVVDKVFVVDKPVAWVEVDRHQQIADADVENNRWPQVIDDALLTVTTRSESGNPLRTYLREQARAEGTTAVEAFGTRLAEAWTQALADGAKTPEAARDALLALPEVASLVDPWSRPFVLELSDNIEAFEELAEGTRSADEVVLVVIRSSGQDGEPNTSDDLTWQVYVDGVARP